MPAMGGGVDRVSVVASPGLCLCKEPLHMLQEDENIQLLPDVAALDTFICNTAPSHTLPDGPARRERFVSSRLPPCCIL